MIMPTDGFQVTVLGTKEAAVNIKDDIMEQVLGVNFSFPEALYQIRLDKYLIVKARQGAGGRRKITIVLKQDLAL